MSQINRYPSLNQPIESLVGNDGIVVPPIFDGVRWDVFVLGAGHVVTSGNVALGTLTISLDGGIAELYPTDNGVANPIGGVLNIFGGSNINTAAPAIPGNSVIVNLDDNVHITGNFIADLDITSATGDISATLGFLNAGTTVTAGTGITSTTGNITASAGDVNITAGNLNLPNTNAAGTQGEITFGFNRFISNYGFQNTFVGSNSGSTALGVFPQGSFNVGLGTNALQGINDGDANTSAGVNSCFSLTTGRQNCAFGTSALEFITSGIGNIALGRAAGGNLTLADSQNICIGNLGVTGFSNKIYLGDDAVQDACFIAGEVTGLRGITATTFLTATAGDITATAGNVVIVAGNLGLPNTNIGGTNGLIAFGGNPYIHNYGNNNFFLGNSAGDYAVTLTGSGNHALGRSSMQGLTSGSDNSALGDVSLQSLTSGIRNSAFGSSSLSLLTSGDNCIGIGFLSGSAYTIETSNICINHTGIIGDNNIIRIGTDGAVAGQQTDCYIAGSTHLARNLKLQNTNAGGTVGEIEFNNIRWISNFGVANTFVGGTSGNTALAGSQNSGFGGGSLADLVNGSDNSFCGFGSGSAITDGTRNSGLGSGVLIALLTGSNNIGIGYGAGIAYNGAQSSNICIGNAGDVADNNTIRIGTQGAAAGEQDRCFVAGIRGVATTTTDAGIALIASDHQLGSTGSMTNGQLAIGSTGLNPVLGTITAGTGMNIVNGAGSITTNVVGGGITWTVETVDLAAVASHGYLANKAGTLAISLPAVSAIGDVIKVINIGATAVGWRITQGAGQRIWIGTALTTIGAAGYVEATHIADALELVCFIANTEWIAVSAPQGNITVV